MIVGEGKAGLLVGRTPREESSSIVEAEPNETMSIASASGLMLWCRGILVVAMRNSAAAAIGQMNYLEQETLLAGKQSGKTPLRWYDRRFGGMVRRVFGLASFASADARETKTKRRVPT